MLKTERPVRRSVPLGMGTQALTRQPNNNKEARMYESIDANEDYSRCNTEVDFAEWLEGSGWDDAKAFERSTGVAFEELKGKWFTVVHDRVFLK